ncbi:MAG TPA: hypothetical protein DCX21_03045 [Eubacterium sp.]|nr:hypothetical protein [Eubacterium sp.]
MLDRVKRRKIIEFFSDSVFVKAFMDGFIRLIPFIYVASFTTLLLNFPFDPYMNWLTSTHWLARSYYLLVTFLNRSTNDYMAVYVALSVGWSYASTLQMKTGRGLILGALCAQGLLIMSSNGLQDIDKRFLSNQGIFTAVIVCLMVCPLYKILIQAKDEERRIRRHYRLQKSMNVIMHNFSTIIYISLILSCLSLAINQITDGNNLQELVSEYIANTLFRPAVIDKVSVAFLYILTYSLLWFFGIHGQNFLYMINDGLYNDLLMANVDGGAHNIINTGFFNIFCNMGGSGCMLALMLTSLAISKNKAAKTVSSIALVPGLFNISEMVFFGIPVAFNPAFLIPMTVAPMFNCAVAYIATRAGFIPIVANNVSWATPIFVNGYLSTGSINTIYLQAVLLVVDMLIFVPFYKFFEESENLKLEKRVRQIEDILKEHEESSESITLSELNGILGDTVDYLKSDLWYAIAEHELFLMYQPQSYADNKYFGAEALIRWDHYAAGRIYPPLIIKLAKEGGFLPELERFILRESANTISQINALNLPNVRSKISANITGNSADDEHFVDTVKAAVDEYKIDPKDLCIEITEQETISGSDAMYERLREVHKMGHKFFIDDFGMGHTSVNYLKLGIFDGVKLDGKITKGVITNEEDRSIISSVAMMCEKLNLTLVAEFVTDNEQEKLLKELGCEVFQGGLHSGPLVFDDLLEYIKEHSLSDGI